jgi:hypothetical protein
MKDIERSFAHEERESMEEIKYWKDKALYEKEDR